MGRERGSIHKSREKNVTGDGRKEKKKKKRKGRKGEVKK